MTRLDKQILSQMEQELPFFKHWSADRYKTYYLMTVWEEGGNLDGFKAILRLVNKALAKVRYNTDKVEKVKKTDQHVRLYQMLLDAYYHGKE